MNQLFDSGSGSGYSKLFQKSAKLHNKCHFSGRKILSNAHRSDQRQRYQNVCFDVKFRHQSNDGFQNNRKSAQHNGNPGHVKGERGNSQQT